MSKEFYEEIRNSSRDNADRYRNCKLLKDIESGDTLLATREIQDIPIRSTDTYHRVMSHEIYRLDVLANKYYKNPLLWWVIAQANDIKDPLTPLVPGVLLRIPSIETLYGSNGILL